MTCLLQSLCFVRATSYTSLQSYGDTGIDDSFFDILTKIQGQRMDDQRTSLPSPGSKTNSVLSEDDDLFDVLCRLQGARLNDQRAVLRSLPSHVVAGTEEEADSEENAHEDVFVQDQNMGDVRPHDPRRSTMPSEDFFNLIQHLQSTRIEDQRSPLPVPLMAN